MAAGALFVPECEKDGGYSLKQCIPSYGMCWCVDSNGNPLAGTGSSGNMSCPPKGKLKLKD